jgi:hypothetical protein
MTAETATMTRPTVHFVTPTGQTFSDYVRAQHIQLRGLFLDYVTAARRIDPEKTRPEDEWDRLWHGFATSVRFGFNLFCKGNVTGPRDLFYSFCKTRAGATDADGKLRPHTWREWSDLLEMYEGRDQRNTQADALV